MISDVLSDAIHQMDDYLNNVTMYGQLSHEGRRETRRVRDEMERLRHRFDSDDPQLWGDGGVPRTSFFNRQP